MDDERFFMNLLNIDAHIIYTNIYKIETKKKVINKIFTWKN